MEKEEAQHEAAKPFEEITYTGDQSPEYDKYLQQHESTNAPQGGISEVTTEKIITSGWHVPCHCIVIRAENGECQAFHVQPNKISASLLTFEQRSAMNKMATFQPSAIVAKGEKSCFGFADLIELASFGIPEPKVIDVNTNQWWRLLYDPKKDELWIDIKEQKILKKYRGFIKK